MRPRAYVAAAVFLGWVRRQDVAGALGGGSRPRCARGEAWWREREFEQLPEPPADFHFGTLAEPTPQGCAACEERAAVDTLYLPGILPQERTLGAVAGREVG